MPGLEQWFGLYDHMVVWTVAGIDDYGAVTLNSPMEVSMRYEEVQREIVDDRGQTVVTDAVATVDRSIAAGSIVWKGGLLDKPSIPTGLKRVAAVTSIPDIRGRATYRELSLVRYNDSLPALA